MEGRANYLIDPIEEIGNGGYNPIEKIRLFNSSHSSM
jgi:serine/threonine-protein kinase